MTRPFASVEPLIVADLPSGDWAGSIPSVGVAAFSDDIELAKDRRIRIRVCATDVGPGRFNLDFTDSGDLDDDGRRFGLADADIRVASAFAFADILHVTPSQQFASGLEVVTRSDSWVGAGVAQHPAARAMAMARVYDAVCGALSTVWPSRSRAGSNTLGAIVSLTHGEETALEILPGGQGADSKGPGRHAWLGPILEPRLVAQWPAWLSVHQTNRKDSGGVGARNGGDGVVRRYTVDADVIARVAIDRRGNPPHGLDRAGPPQPARADVISMGAQRPIEAWSATPLAKGETLVVQTAGGAGHGFPGYGDIEFDPSDWFGSGGDG